MHTYTVLFWNQSFIYILNKYDIVIILISKRKWCMILCIVFQYKFILTLYLKFEFLKRQTHIFAIHTTVSLFKYLNYIFLDVFYFTITTVILIYAMSNILIWKVFFQYWHNQTDSADQLINSENNSYSRTNPKKNQKW